jgi:hypothetical protein
MRNFVALLAVLFIVLLISCEQAQKVEAPDLTGAAKDFVGLLAKGEYADAVAKFDDTMKGVMPEAELKVAWQSLLTKVGPFQKIVSVSQKKEQGYDVAHVTCAFEKAELDVKVVYNSQQQVSGLWFVPK